MLEEVKEPDSGEEKKRLVKDTQDKEKDAEVDIPPAEFIGTMSSGVRWVLLFSLI